MMHRLLASLVCFIGSSAFGQTVTWQGITLEPGDVINFRDGAATLRGLLGHGHTALFLGIDPEREQPVFLDFTTTKTDSGGIPSPYEAWTGNTRPFRGRILPEVDFLRYYDNRSLDVFRLKDRSKLNADQLLRQAQLLSNNKTYFPLNEVCSSAVASVLSKSSGGTKIVGTLPDALADGGIGDLAGGLFERHPNLPEEGISTTRALHDAHMRGWQGALVPPKVRAHPSVPAAPPSRPSKLVGEQKRLWDAYVAKRDALSAENTRLWDAYTAKRDRQRAEYDAAYSRWREKCSRLRAKYDAAMAKYDRDLDQWNEEQRRAEERYQRHLERMEDIRYERESREREQRSHPSVDLPSDDPNFDGQ